jgi:hypothetical protein
MNDKDSKGDHDLSSIARIMPAIEGIVRILSSLNSDERRRVIDGALVILRESSGDVRGIPRESDEPTAIPGISPRAQIWVRQNGLTSEQIGEIFEVSAGATAIIASDIMGRNNADKTIKAYVLAGVAEFLTSGEPSFHDKQARQLCEELGFYDSTNHSKYMKEKGNYLVGDKDKGWKLTAPGLKYAAAIIKEIAGGSGGQ